MVAIQKTVSPDRRQYSTIREDGAESLQGLTETAGLPKYHHDFGNSAFLLPDAGIAGTVRGKKGSMRTIRDLAPSSTLLRLMALCLVVLSLTGCASMKSVQDTFGFSGHPDTEIERTRFPLAKGEDVIGRLAVMRVAPGDTLPDIARHFSLGLTALSAANPKADTWVPEAGEELLLPLSFILPDTPRTGIVVNLATMRLFQFTDDGTSLKVSTYPVGIGTEERPSPTGQMRVVRKAARPTWHVPASIAEDHRKKGDLLPAKIPPGPENPLGEYALYLSKAGYLIHGTNKPASIGLQATNGCLRLYPEHIERLYQDTPTATSVLIVNQPYLIGQRDGVLYLEAHVPLEESPAGERERISAQLRSIEKKAARPLDWDTVRKVQTEARGIPVPIFELEPGRGRENAHPLRLAHPDLLYGRPEPPGPDLDGWYVLAAEAPDETDARRVAAMISHQGPPIPARVSSGGTGHRVIAGPFKSAGEAREAARRLKRDLNLDGIVIEPVRKG